MNRAMSSSRSIACCPSEAAAPCTWSATSYGLWSTVDTGISVRDLSGRLNETAPGAPCVGSETECELGFDFHSAASYSSMTPDLGCRPAVDTRIAGSRVIDQI